MSLKLTILGCYSAVPTVKKQQTAQLLNVNERFFLIDCGENTQVQLRKYELSFQRIHHVFISHLHGDHYYGLIGLITSMHLLGRKKELHVYAHVPLKDIINTQLSASKTDLNFPLFFHTIPDDDQVILYEDEDIEVTNVILDHSISCSGFLFREKKHQRKIIKEKIEEHKVPYDRILDLRNGSDFINEDGEIIDNNILTNSNVKARTYAYCSDTRFCLDIIPKIKNVDVLYHEATYSHDLKEKAFERGHSTAKDAATIAKEANVNRLIIGHYSKRYQDLNILLSESREIFSNTFLAHEGDILDFDLI
jgi:ribonuclease Z